MSPSRARLDKTIFRAPNPRIGFTISKNYLLEYPDGSKKHVTRAERDDLLLSGLARQTASNRYFFTGQCRTLHSLSELSQLNIGSPKSPKRRFLPGCFIFELNGKRQRELLETPDACAMRLRDSNACAGSTGAHSDSSQATN